MIVFMNGEKQNGTQLWLGTIYNNKPHATFSIRPPRSRYTVSVCVQCTYAAQRKMPRDN